MNERTQRLESRSQVRMMLSILFKLDSHLDAFCTDHFPAVAQEFTAGMTRTAKENILINNESITNILACLRERNLTAFQEATTKVLSQKALSIETPIERTSISAELRMQLMSLVPAVQLSREKLVAAYLESAPKTWGRQLHEFADAALIETMLAKLSTALKQQDGTHPILLFVLYLARLVIAAPVIIQLHDWFKDAAEYLDVDVEAQRCMQDRVGRALMIEQVMHLVVVVREMPSNGNSYGVRAYRVIVPPDQECWFDQNISALDMDPDRAYSVEELPGMLDELFEQVVDELCRCQNNLIIELMVPLGLLNCAADRWALQRGLRASVPFGVPYRVVLRSWERSYDPLCRRIAPFWKKKWNRIQSSNGPSYIWKNLEIEPSAATLHELADSVLIGFVPEPNVVLGQLVEAGVPIAAWPRESSVSGQLETCLAMLARQPMRWPELIREYRCAAHSGTDPEHLGYHLSVLWDDPNKILPDARQSARLVSPSKCRKP